MCLLCVLVCVLVCICVRPIYSGRRSTSTPLGSGYISAPPARVTPDFFFFHPASSSACLHFSFSLTSGFAILFPHRLALTAVIASQLGYSSQVLTQQHHNQFKEPNSASYLEVVLRSYKHVRVLVFWEKIRSSCKITAAVIRAHDPGASI